MVTLAKILDLPPDDAEAFLAFEEHAREAMEQRISNANSDDSWSPFWLAYMATVQQASIECGLGDFTEWSIRPPVGHDEFQRFEHEVLAVKTRLQFRVARRIRGELLEPDTSDREKIKFRVQQLRDEVEASDLPPSKKVALYEKLDQLVEEFEGKRVSRGKVLVILTAVAALMNQTQGMLLKGPETMVAVMDSIGMLVGKEDERQALLERYRKPLAIEHKHESTGGLQTSPREDFSEDLDDEIPF